MNEKSMIEKLFQIWLHSKLNMIRRSLPVSE